MPDGKSSYRTDKHRAFAIVKSKKGFWVNEQHTGVQKLSDPEIEMLKPRQLSRANWDLIPSPDWPPGPTVWQIAT